MTDTQRVIWSALNSIGIEDSRLSVRIHELLLMYTVIVDNKLAVEGHDGAIYSIYDAGTGSNYKQYISLDEAMLIVLGELT